MLSSALASSSRLGINTKARSGLGLREHFFPRLFEQSALPPAQAFQTAVGNLFEQWIYLLGDKLIGTHGTEPRRFDPALTKHALNERGAAKSEKMGRKPTREHTTDKDTETDTTGAIANKRG